MVQENVNLTCITKPMLHQNCKNLKVTTCTLFWMMSPSTTNSASIWVKNSISVIQQLWDMCKIWRRFKKWQNKFYKNCQWSIGKHPILLKKKPFVEVCYRSWNVVSLQELKELIFRGRSRTTDNIKSNILLFEKKKVIAPYLERYEKQTGFEILLKIKWNMVFRKVLQMNDNTCLHVALLTKNKP